MFEKQLADAGKHILANVESAVEKSPAFAVAKTKLEADLVKLKTIVAKITPAQVEAALGLSTADVAELEQVLADVIAVAFNPTAIIKDIEAAL